MPEGVLFCINRVWSPIKLFLLGYTLLVRLNPEKNEVMPFLIKARSSLVRTHSIMDRQSSLKSQLDNLHRTKTEYYRKVQHENQMAKLEIDATESNRRLQSIRQKYFERIVDKL